MCSISVLVASFLPRTFLSSSPPPPKVELAGAHFAPPPPLFPFSWLLVEEGQRNFFRLLPSSWATLKKEANFSFLSPFFSLPFSKPKPTLSIPTHGQSLGGRAESALKEDEEIKGGGRLHTVHTWAEGGNGGGLTPPEKLFNL